MLSVFKYKIAIQIPNTTAEIIPPKLWRDPNNNEEIAMANVVGTKSFNLDSNTPLKINSSQIGEIITVEINVPIRGKELVKAMVGI